MNPISVLLVEDNPKEAILLKNQLDRNNCNIVAIAQTLDEALKCYYAEDIDLVIIDVFLGDAPHGITFAEVISKNTTQLKPFLFLTGSTAIEVFESAKLTHPSSYLLKPYNELELVFAIQLALEKFSGTINGLSRRGNPSIYFDQRFFVKKNNVLYKLLPSEIQYVSVEGRYSCIVSKDGNFIVKLSLKEFLKIIEDSHFLRVHRNFIVNLSHIQKVYITDNLILLEDGSKITLSKKYRADFLARYRVLV